MPTLTNNDDNQVLRMVYTCHVGYMPSIRLLRSMYDIDILTYSAAEQSDKL